MKKISFLLTAFFLFASTFASSVIKPAFVKANEIFLPLGKNMKISLQELSVISVKDFQKISGKHLNFIDRFGFKAGQRKLRNSINSDGTINNKRLLKHLSEEDHSVGFHLGGFALGFLLSLLGVLIAYVIGGDEDVKRNRTKWAWIGCAVIVGLSLILVAVAAKSIY